MNQFSINEKFAIITILSKIMNADGIVHPNEEEYMNNLYIEWGITIGDLEDMNNMDDIQAKAVVKGMQDEKRQLAKRLFVSMAEADGYVHPLEKAIISNIFSV